MNTNLNTSQSYLDTLNIESSVYNLLQDDISKGIFIQRIIHNITDSNICGLAPYVNDTLRSYYLNILDLKRNQNLYSEIIIYGCTTLVRELFFEFKETSRILFCDRNYKSLMYFQNIPVISPEELISHHKKATIFLCVGSGNSVVTQFLMENQIPKENIVQLGVTDTESQYFDEIMNFTENEVFVDAGAFDGATSVLFANKLKGKYKKIFLIEPDPSNIEKINNNLCFTSLNNTSILNYGLWDKRENLKFTTSCNEASKVIETDSHLEQNDFDIVSCDSLDNLLNGELVTYIKMDIEGAELKGLMGARNTIEKYKPKLAISIYHKAEDIIELPLYIKELVPEYKLYLRHHSSSLSETVLYATI